MRRNPVCLTDESALITVVSQCGILSVSRPNSVVVSCVFVFGCLQVSQYDIPNSQETASTSASEKKRKFSEPKERF